MTKLYLILFLLSCGVAEAQQDLYTDCFHPSNDSTVYDICRMPDMRKILSEPKSCELKMKEAMKIIAPYIDYGDAVSTTDALYRSPQTKLREEADRLDRRDAVMRKWTAIYQECVK